MLGELELTMFFIVSIAIIFWPESNRMLELKVQALKSNYLYPETEIPKSKFTSISKSDKTIVSINEYSYELEVNL